MNTKEFLNQQWVKDEIISRLTYNPETGSLVWSERGIPHLDKRICGKEVGYSWFKDGYINHKLSLEFKGRKVSVVVARLCWLVHTGDWPKHTIDHIDRDPLNNTWDNLRDVPQCENNRNRSKHYKTTPLKYIRKREGGWEIFVKQKYIAFTVCLGKALKIRDQYLKDNNLPPVNSS